MNVVKKIIESVFIEESMLVWNRFKIFGTLFELLTGEFADYQVTYLQERILTNKQAEWKKLQLIVELTETTTNKEIGKA